MNFEVGEKRDRVAPRVRSRERARMRGAGALSAAQDQGLARQVELQGGSTWGAARRGRGGRAAPSACAESPPRNLPGDCVPSSLKLASTEPSPLRPRPAPPPTFPACLISPGEWMVAGS